MIKEIIGSYLDKKKREREIYKEELLKHKIQKKIENNEKSLDEKELERYLSQEKAKKIKNEVEYWRKKRENELKKINIAKTPNMFKNAPNIFKIKKAPLMIAGGKK